MKGAGLFYDTTSTIFIPDINYDYMITVFTDTFYISNLEEEITTFTACHGEMPKMVECQLFYTYTAGGNETSKSGNIITITK